MLERIKAVFGFGRKKKQAETIKRPSAPGLRDIKFGGDDDLVIPAGVGFDSLEHDIRVPRPVRAERTRRDDDTPRHIETPPAPVWTPPASPAWEPPASPRSYNDDTPPYSSSGSHSSCSSSSSSHSSSSDSGSSSSGDSGSSSCGD
jgi:uncharacterized membrane protein YgcG